MDIKLNLGCGRKWQMAGWMGLDKNLGHDFDNKLLEEFDNESVDVIYSSHFFEHISSTRGLVLLQDCYRVLIPRGLIRIVVPDTERMWSILQGGDRSVLDESPHFSASAHRTQSLVSVVKEQYGFTGETHHKCWYSPGVVCSFLMFSGFPTGQIFRREFRESQVAELQTEAVLERHTRHTLSGFDSANQKPISLYVEAVKEKSDEEECTGA